MQEYRCYQSPAWSKLPKPLEIWELNVMRSCRYSGIDRSAWGYERVKSTSSSCSSNNCCWRQKGKDQHKQQYCWGSSCEACLPLRSCRLLREHCKALDIPLIGSSSFSNKL